MKITARTLSGQACDFQIEGRVFKKITKLKRDVPRPSAVDRAGAD